MKKVEKSASKKTKKMAKNNKLSKQDIVQEVVALMNVFKVLMERGKLTIFVTSDEQEVYMHTKAGAAFAVLHDCIWGKFRTMLKHGDPNKEYKTPADAIEAYRQYIGELMDQNGIIDI